ncbi:MAG: recombinase family protein [Bacteroidota bacterium]
MRTAVAYARVSTADQAEGYSLRAQDAVNDRCAAKHGGRVVERFLDDVSAKQGDRLTESFDRRPGWQSLLRHLRANPARRGGPDLVVFKDYSRFSRHVAAAWAMLHELQRLGVEVQAAEQPVDWESPEHVHVVSAYLAVPDADNRRRSKNIRRGVRQAHLEGRWVHAPPTGYRATYSVPEGKNKPRRTGIEPDPTLAPLVAKAFLLAADPSVPVNAARKRVVRPNGRPLFGSAYRFGQALRNRAYRGELRVPPGDGQPERWIEGRHEPVVDAQTWAAVQARLDGPKAKPNGREKKLKLTPELPLRGHILDPRTGDRLTGSGSKSRHGYRVWYYHGKGRGAFRVKAEAAHAALVEFYRELSPTPGFLAVLEAVCEEELASRADGASIELANAETELAAAERRQLDADLAVVDGRLGPDAYARVAEHNRSAVDRARARAQAARLASADDVDADLEAFRYALPLLSDLAGLWEASGAEGRHALVGSTFPRGLSVDHGQIVEPSLGPLFSALAVAKTPKMETADPEGSADFPGSGDAGTVWGDARSTPRLHPSAILRR